MLISEGGYMKQRDRAKGDMRLVDDIRRLQRCAKRLSLHLSLLKSG